MSNSAIVGRGYLGNALFSTLEGRQGISSLIQTPARCTNQNGKAVSKRINDVGLYLSNLSQFEMSTQSVDCVIYVAGPDRISCFSNTAAALDFRTSGLFQFLQKCSDVGVKKFVYVSSMHVLGNRLHSPGANEFCYPDPSDYYAFLHRLSESILEFCSKQFDMKVTVIRTANIFGMEKFGGVGREKTLFKSLINDAFYSNKVVFNNHENFEINLVTMQDLIELVYNLISNVQVEKFKLLHLCSKNVVTIREVYQCLVKALQNVGKVNLESKFPEGIDTSSCAKNFFCSDIIDSEYVGLDDIVLEFDNIMREFHS